MFFYSDRECSNAIKDGAVLGTSGDYAGFPPNNLVQTNENDLKEETRCTQGSECPDWWSAGLNVNPYEVDETHGSAVHVDVQVPASADVQCVRVISRSYGEGQRRQYFPSEQVLYRGWETNVRQSGSLTPSPVTIDGWTSGWFAKADLGEAGDSGMITTFVPSHARLIRPRVSIDLTTAGGFSKYLATVILNHVRTTFTAGEVLDWMRC